MIEGKRKDIRFTEDGDLFLFEGKVESVDNEENELLLDILFRRLQSYAGDWGTNKALENSINSYRGEVLNETTVELIGEEIRRIFMEEELVFDENILVKALKADAESVVFGVEIYNKKNKNRDLYLGFVYDQRVSQIIPRYIKPRGNELWRG